MTILSAIIEYTHALEYCCLFRDVINLLISSLCVLFAYIVGLCCEYTICLAYKRTVSTNRQEFS